MKRDKLTLALIITALAVTFIDILYAVFLISEFALLYAGRVFVFRGFEALAITAVVVNTSALAFGIVYYLLRRKGTIIK